MKRIIPLFIVMLAFGLSANAQDKKAAAKPAVNQEKAVSKEASFDNAGIKDVEALSQLVKLSADQKVTLKSLFTEKHRMYAQNISEERKTILAKNIEAKLKSVLEPAQLTKLKGNTQLLNSLTH
ncbi:hypothetical protein ACX0HA_05280 [Flavobacterium hauense]